MPRGTMVVSQLKLKSKERQKDKVLDLFVLVSVYELLTCPPVLLWHLISLDPHSSSFSDIIDTI